MCCSGYILPSFITFYLQKTLRQTGLIRVRMLKELSPFALSKYIYIIHTQLICVGIYYYLKVNSTYRVEYSDLPKLIQPIYYLLTSVRLKVRRNQHLWQYIPVYTVVEYAFSDRTLFDDTAMLAKTSDYYNLIRREAMEIIQRPNNIDNRDKGWYLSRIWFSAQRNKRLKKHLDSTLVVEMTFGSLT